MVVLIVVLYVERAVNVRLSVAESTDAISFPRPPAHFLRIVYWFCGDGLLLFVLFVYEVLSQLI